MPRHSFIRLSKLTDVCGRVDYISSPQRQEHLYAVYTDAEPDFWARLAQQARFNFRRSHQPTGRCIEGRELIIALPEEFRKLDPDALLREFAAAFTEKYGVRCAAALHHNKAMTNYHIHLVFADRTELEEPEVRYASRNMFFDENGRHVRTKKEILAEDGTIRPGCSILPKGEPTEVRCFTGRLDIFKSKAFLTEVKQMFTDMINSHIENEADRQQVFNPEGPYLATRKIGKNNPLAEEIAADNALRQQWNQAVDQVLAAGGSEKEVLAVKEETVAKPVAESIHRNGFRPGLLADILRRAIEILREFLQRLLQRKTVDNLPQGNSELQKMAKIAAKLKRATRRTAALAHKADDLRNRIAVLPDNLFHRREREELEHQLAETETAYDRAQDRLSRLPQRYGYDTVYDFERAYREARRAAKIPEPPAEGSLEKLLADYREQAGNTSRSPQEQVVRDRKPQR